MDDIDDDASVVLTIHPVFAIPDAPQLGVPAVTRAIVIPAPEPRVVARSRDFVERLIHAPPRAPAPLRGPPSSSLL
jgi:hypothetical protein